jgi:hypothetical protein
MPEQNISKVEEKLDQIISLLQQSVAVQLFAAGASKGEVQKNLKMNRAKVFAMLAGLKKDEED